MRVFEFQVEVCRSRCVRPYIDGGIVADENGYLAHICDFKFEDYGFSERIRLFAGGQGNPDLRAIGTD